MLQLASIIYGNNIQNKHPLSLIRELKYAILSLALTSLLNFLSWLYDRNILCLLRPIYYKEYK